MRASASVSVGMRVSRCRYAQGWLDLFVVGISRVNRRRVEKGEQGSVKGTQVLSFTAFVYV